MRQIGKLKYISVINTSMTTCMITLNSADVHEAKNSVLVTTHCGCTVCYSDEEARVSVPLCASITRCRNTFYRRRALQRALSRGIYTQTY